MAFDVDIEEGAVVFDERTVPGLVRDFAARLQRNLRRSPHWPVDSGRSRRGFLVAVKGRRVEVGNTTDYAPYVGRGRNAARVDRTFEQAANKSLKEVAADGD